MRTFKNPILKGFYPDPSICRAGDDFYLVTSSFSYFPGIPLFHSRDLCNWESYGYVFNDPAVLKLNPEKISGGLFAPTIRYHEGKFYVIVCNTSTNETLIAVTDDPERGWPEVHILAGAGGDPSLFFDDDGSCYCTYNTMSTKGGIEYRILDLEKFDFTGDPVWLWNGAAVDAWSPEASHLYKINGWYYLMIAEGGTEHYHAVTVARSRSVDGPYESYRGNPILTHRHLSMYYPICNVGHADLVETPKGQWYMVFLASRVYGGYHKNMGRETFMAPVTWENGWPVVSGETGKVEWEYPAPDLPPFQTEILPERDDFEGSRLNWTWNFLGSPDGQECQVKDSRLVIRTSELPMNAQTQPPFELEGNVFEFSPEVLGEYMRNLIANFRPYSMGFVGRRQQDIDYEVMTQMTFRPLDEAEAAGLVLLQNDYNQIRMEKTKCCGKDLVRVIRHRVVRDAVPIGQLPDLFARNNYEDTLLGSIAAEGDTLLLKFKAEGQNLTFYAGSKEEELAVVAEGVDAGFLGSETAGGFVGAYIGLFATANWQQRENSAAFDWFIYKAAR